MKLILFVVLLIELYGTSAAPDKIVCYLGSWSVYRNGIGKYNIEDIDPNRCTHLIYGFAGVNIDGSIKVLDPWYEINSGAFRRFNDLKNKNPNLKTLIALGGWSEGSNGFSKVAANANLRSTLANNIVSFMNQYGFDGCDFDWEYPTERDGSSIYDKANFAELLRVCRARFDSTGRRYLLTAAVAVLPSVIDKYYDVSAMFTYLDFINLMAYDIHASYDGVTGQNAPLFPAGIDTTDYARQRNVQAGVDAWLQRGQVSSKLVMGLASYGRSFTLTNQWNNQLGGPSSGPGNAGTYTSEAGFISYYEVCDLQKQGGWTVVWDDVQKVPYAYKGDQWIGYDNPTSIKLKVEFAKYKNLGGLMLWSIDMDDTKGLCGPRYPILSAVREALGGGGGTTTVPTTETPANTCQKNKYYRDAVDCSKFHYCTNEGIEYDFVCPADLYYDTTLGICNYRSAVQC